MTTIWSHPSFKWGEDFCVPSEVVCWNCGWMAGDHTRVLGGPLANEFVCPNAPKIPGYPRSVIEKATEDPFKSRRVKELQDELAESRGEVAELQLKINHLKYQLAEAKRNQEYQTWRSAKDASNAAEARAVGLMDDLTGAGHTIDKMRTVATNVALRRLRVKEQMRRLEHRIEVLRKMVDSKALHRLLNLIEFGHWGGHRVGQGVPSIHGISASNSGFQDKCPVCHAMAQVRKDGLLG